MIQNPRLFKSLILFAVGYAASLAAPSALAACSCMCVDAAPMEVCTGFVTTRNTTAECTAQLSCPAVEEPPVEEPAPEDPVAEIDPPHPGLTCERRSVYRPDEGKYRKYKVCRLENKLDRLAEKHARKEDRWAKRSEAKRGKKRGEKWEARNEAKMQAWREKYARKKSKVESKLEKHEDA